MMFLPSILSVSCHKHTTPPHTLMHKTHTQCTLTSHLFGRSCDIPISKSFELAVAFDIINYSLKHHLHFASRTPSLILRFLCCFLVFPPELSVLSVPGLSIRSSDVFYLHLLRWWSHPVSCTIYKPTTTKLICPAQRFIWTLNSHMQIFAEHFYLYLH